MDRLTAEEELLAVETPQNSWAAKAEAAIGALRDVEGASIQMAGDEIREVHVLTRSSRPPKQIVRDVQTVLVTRFHRHIDYRVVSVAYVGADAPRSAPEGASLAAWPPPRMSVATSLPDASPPASNPVAPMASTPVATRASDPMAAPLANPTAAPASKPIATTAASPTAMPTANPAPTPAPTNGAASPARIRFGSVNLYVAGPRTQVQVELKWAGASRMGSASGWSTRAGAHQLIASAALAATQQFLADDVALSAQDVEFLRLGTHTVAVVSISVLAHRQAKTLVGTCVVEQDEPEAVVLATLSALNRFVGGLGARPPVNG
ncbi:MAG TPA: hypothetical protein VGK93_08825 [Candidatus Eisenbacteria bacterium]|jgi:hypothetical protein